MPVKYMENTTCWYCTGLILDFGWKPISNKNNNIRTISVSYIKTGSSYGVGNWYCSNISSWFEKIVHKCSLHFNMNSPSNSIQFMLFIVLLSYAGHLTAVTTQEPMSQYTNLVLLSKLYQSNIQCWLGSTIEKLLVLTYVKADGGVIY